MVDMRVRPPGVAGSFYPGSRAELFDTVQTLMSEAGPAKGPPPKAVIAPHAGYVFSGAVAASAYRALEPRARQLRRILLLGPAHFRRVSGLALPGAGRLATPLGETMVDSEAAERALELPQVVEDPAAHEREHCLEVQLPFLQLLFEAVPVVPFLVGAATGDEVAEVLERFWGDHETAIVVSSDLSHYLPYDEAKRVDGETAERILELRGTLAHDEACGATPINGLLIAARRRGLRCRLLDLRNSGETAGGRGRVVGYGAFAFSSDA
jgi:AmmeMemoRadiSam system protein B